jgi:hypothetical protein
VIKASFVEKGLSANVHKEQKHFMLDQRDRRLQMEPMKEMDA